MTSTWKSHRGEKDKGKRMRWEKRLRVPTGLNSFSNKVAVDLRKAGKNNYQQSFFGVQLPATELFTAGKNHWSPTKKENPGAQHYFDTAKSEWSSFLYPPLVREKKLSNFSIFISIFINPFTASWKVSIPRSRLVNRKSLNADLHCTILLTTVACNFCSACCSHHAKNQIWHLSFNITCRMVLKHDSKSYDK